MSRCDLPLTKSQNCQWFLATQIWGGFPLLGMISTKVEGEQPEMFKPLSRVHPGSPVLQVLPCLCGDFGL